MHSTLPDSYIRTPFLHSSPETRALLVATPACRRRSTLAALGKSAGAALLTIAALFKAAPRGS